MSWKIIHFTKLVKNFTSFYGYSTQQLAHLSYMFFKPDPQLFLSVSRVEAHALVYPSLCFSSLKPFVMLICLEGMSLHWVHWYILHDLNQRNLFGCACDCLCVSSTGDCKNLKGRGQQAELWFPQASESHSI